MIDPNGLLVEQAKVVAGYGPATPSSAVPDYVSLKNYHKLSIIINVLNGTTVTGGAITLLQAQAVANTGEKALAFSEVHANVDTAASDTLVKTAVTSNTFTTNATNSKSLQYVIDVKPEDLDIANNFDCVRLGVGNTVNAVVSVVYVLWPAKYAGATPPSAIID